MKTKIKDIIKSAKKAQALIKKMATEAKSLNPQEAKDFIKLQLAVGKNIKTPMRRDVLIRVEDYIEHGYTFDEAINEVKSEGASFDIINLGKEAMIELADQLGCTKLPSKDLSDVLQNRFDNAVKFIEEKYSFLKKEEKVEAQEVEEEFNDDDNYEFWKEYFEKDK